MNSNHIIGIVLVVSVLVNLYQAYLYRQKNLVRQVTATITSWADLATGSSGDIEIERGFLGVLQEQYQLFCKKQHDYGRTNVAVGGEQGLTIRLGDKVSRLFNLQGIGYGAKKRSAAPSVNESLRDTFLDIGNYGPMGVMLIDGLWPRVRPEDVWGSLADNKDESEFEDVLHEEAV